MAGLEVLRPASVGRVWLLLLVFRRVGRRWVLLVRQGLQEQQEPLVALGQQLVPVLVEQAVLGMQEEQEPPLLVLPLLFWPPVLSELQTMPLSVLNLRDFRSKTIRFLQRTRSYRWRSFLWEYSALE